MDQSGAKINQTGADLGRFSSRGCEVLAFGSPVFLTPFIGASGTCKSINLASKVTPRYANFDQSDAKLGQGGVKLIQCGAVFESTGTRSGGVLTFGSPVFSEPSYRDFRDTPPQPMPCARAPRPLGWHVENQRSKQCSHHRMGKSRRSQCPASAVPPFLGMWKIRGRSMGVEKLNSRST